MKVYKYVSNCVSMMYALPEFLSAKPLLEKLHGYEVRMVKIKNRCLGNTVIYYVLNKNKVKDADND